MDNKDILPFHLFHHNDRHYVINIECMQVSLIDTVTAEALKTVSTEPRTSLSATSENPVPVSTAALLLTQACNLQCIYCYEKKDGSSMTEKTAYQAVDWLIAQAGNVKNINIFFFGGEPLLNFSLMKAVVAYAEKRVRETGKTVKFRITTNGTLLDDEKIAFFKEHQISAMISFDGPKELQDAQRPYANGQGSYDSTVPKIKKLLEVLPQTPAHAVIVGDTNPEEVKNDLQNIGFERITIAPNSESLFTAEADKVKQNRNMRVLIETLEEEAKAWNQLIENRDSETFRKLMAKSGLYPALLALFHNAKKRHACGAGRGLVAVSPSGDVYLCHRFVGMDAYKLGSVYDPNLNRGEYNKSPLDVNEACTTCFARYYCAGGCMHDNASSCGFISTQDENLCRLRRRELELATTIISRLTPEDQDFLIDEKILPPKPCLLDF